MKQSITLLGMSGVGKTTLSRKLPTDKWFHYSGDYRIATHYLKDSVNDFLMTEAMQIPLLAELLKSDSIFIGSNVTVDNLAPLSAFIGKLGRADLGGLDMETFLTRQRQHRTAEIAACYDVGYFKTRAQQLYGYTYFLHDASGSFCELDDDEVLAYLAKETDFVYLHADEDLADALTERALSHPKPLYYNEFFLTSQVKQFNQAHAVDNIADMVPNDFIQYVIPSLVQHRLKRYVVIAEKYGKQIDARDAFAVRDEKDFLDLIQQTPKAR